MSFTLHNNKIFKILLQVFILFFVDFYKVMALRAIVRRAMTIVLYFATQNTYTHGATQLPTIVQTIANFTSPKRGKGNVLLCNVNFYKKRLFVKVRTLISWVTKCAVFSKINNKVYKAL